MAAAMVLLGGGFVFMVIGARRSDAGALVSPLWLIAAYVFHTWGELCLSPIGLSLVTKLAPLKFASVFMGLWFVATAIAELLAGQLAAATDRIARGEAFHLLGGQADFFLIFVISSLVAAVGLVALTPKLRRLMHGRDV
jgi:POT family proton-dependent oligopeptide transporter